MDSIKFSEGSWVRQTAEEGRRTYRPKSRSSKLREGSRARQTPEESRRTYRPKRCGNNNRYEDNSPKTLNDKNHTKRNGYRRWFPNLLRRKSSAGCRNIWHLYPVMANGIRTGDPRGFNKVLWRFTSSTNSWRRPEDISAETLWK